MFTSLLTDTILKCSLRGTEPSWNLVTGCTCQLSVMNTWHDSQTEVSRRFKANSKNLENREHGWTQDILTMIGILSESYSFPMDSALSGASAIQIRAPYISSVNACASNARVNVRTKWSAQSMNVVVRDRSCAPIDRWNHTSRSTEGRRTSNRQPAREHRSEEVPPMFRSVM